MQNMVAKIITILAVLGICLLAIVFKTPSLGKDLRGGVSLIYAVEMDDDVQDRRATLTNTITVLKERINPRGVYDISMEPMGGSRISITMPLPNAEVVELKGIAEDAIRDLVRKSAIDRFSLQAALQDGAALERFAAGDPESDRGVVMVEAQAAWDALEQANAALDNAPADLSVTERTTLEQEVALAELEYEAVEGRALQLSLGEGRVRRLLDLADDPEPVIDPTTGERVLDEDGDPTFGPSRREQAVDDLKASFASLSADIDAVVAEWEAYEARITGFDDPEDLKRLLRGAGVLEFHIAVAAQNAPGVDIETLRQELQAVGPASTSSPVAKWFAINDVAQWIDEPSDLLALESDPVGYFENRRGLVAAEFESQYYLLLYTTRPKSIDRQGGAEWELTRASATVDELGRPAVSFQLDQAGAARMGKLTAGNTREPMAIVLDGEVYSAPTINSQITSSGQITGQFSQAEIQYLIRVLNAGSLAARLGDEPISMSVLGPSIGADNLERGKEAFIISVIVVAVFMLIYYLAAGIVAVTALAANGIIIFGLLMGIDGTFTLPGLAGVVLTIGMAVDSNVLIYERIREEMFAGELDLRGCVRQGYAKALSTILDGNITNLIVCFVLFQTATTEVKGFALTLTLGICATLFTALFMTRQIFYLYTDVFKAKSLAMLPVKFPSIHRALEPNIDWIGKRHLFWTISIIAVAGSLFLVASRGVDMLDTEFRGGVTMKISTKPVDADGDGLPDRDADGGLVRTPLKHVGEDGVETRIRSIGDRAAELAAGDAQLEQVLQQFGKAQVLTVGETQTNDAGEVVATEFQVKIATPEDMQDDTTITAMVTGAIEDELGADLDLNVAVSFAGVETDDSNDYVFAIEDDILGNSINRSWATEPVPSFRGGAAIVLDELDPPIASAEIERRITRMRNQAEYRAFAGRRVEVVDLVRVDSSNPAAGLTSAVVLVADSVFNYERPDIDDATWRTGFADIEWQLVREALQQPESLDDVNSYSSAVAQTLKANATVAVIFTLLGILVYIWVRFGSLRYSMAAIVALVHDVSISLGLLALSGIVGTTALGSVFLIEPFRIDLGVVAALLTIIGYSLNDTIVILDRIRENRGKLPLPNADTVNRSINQTVSRTLLTSFTTLMAVGIMYAEGGSGIRPFTFCLLAGLITGTYSSVAIAAPLVFAGKAPGKTDLAATAGDTGTDRSADLAKA